MKWTTDMPKYGDIIRVKVKFYHHYGIFVDDGCIVQFGMPDNTGINPDDIEVITTDIDTFRNGGSVETVAFSATERIKKHSDKKTVEIALSRIGQKGYNILHNNCEHFVNECVFGKAESGFVNSVRLEIQKKLGKSK